MRLMNALAACVLSSRLRDEYRRWSLQQLVSGLAALGRSMSASVECLVDTAGDLPKCPTAKLEAHQNRVTSCMFHQRKGLLATRFDLANLHDFVVCYAELVSVVRRRRVFCRSIF